MPSFGWCSSLIIVHCKIYLLLNANMVVLLRQGHLVGVSLNKSLRIGTDFLYTSPKVEVYTIKRIKQNV